MRIYIFFLFLLVCFASSAQGVSTEGKRFWVTFMRNPGTGTIELKLIVSARKACQGEVRNPITNWYVPFAVGDNDLVEIDIPHAEGYTDFPQFVYSKGLLVTSTDTISLYASNFHPASFDVTYVLPEQALSDEYMVQGYTALSYGADLAIVATEDNTVIDILPSATTSFGDPPNVPITITMNKGNSYTLKVLRDDDISGTLVKARDCKKIAVFSGNICANVPTANCCCDHVIEQCFPLNTWGTKFALTSTLLNDKNRVRVTAAQDNTVITRNGVYEATINARETYEFEVDNFTNMSCFLETSNPCAVFLYLTGDTYGTRGDPSMIMITPVEQMIREVTFAAFDTNLTKDHYLNIVTHTLAVSSMRLDGTDISSSFGPLAGNSNFSYARIPIVHGTHTLKNDNGFSAHAYGLGKEESYGYCVGSRAYNLNMQMLVNETPSSQLPSSLSFCLGDTITFEASLNYTPDSVLWNFGNGDKDKGDSVQYAFTANGSYTVNMIVYRSACTAHDTVSVIINVNDPVITYKDSICYGNDYSKHGFSVRTVTKDTIITEKRTASGVCDSTIILNLQIISVHKDSTAHATCDKAYIFNGDVYTASGIYRDTATSASGCDSITILNLTLLPAQDTVLHDTICSGQQFYFHGNFLDTAGTYTDTLTANNGCDSTVTLHLWVNPTHHTILNDTICKGDSLIFNGQVLKNKGVYHDTLFTTKVCDSIITLNLHERERTYLYDGKNICEGEHVYFAGQYVYKTGIYHDTLPALNGCDTIVELNLTVHKPDSVFISKVICENEEFFFNDRWLNSNGSYRDTLLNTAGCDSLVLLNLQMDENDITFLHDTVYKLHPYGNYGFHLPPYFETGFFTEHLYLTNRNFCDSTVILRLTVENCALFPFPYFSPNGDGISDFWVIENIDCMIDYTVHIYDRFGKLLKHYENNFTPWDGMYLEKKMPSTDYWYIIELNNNKQIVGHFTLIR